MLLLLLFFAVILFAYVVNGLVIKVLGGDGSLDDLLENLLAQLLSGDISRVLGRNNNSVDTKGHNSAVVMLVLDSDLGLGVGSQPGQGAIATGSGHGSVQLVGELESEREELGSLIGSVAEHDTLVTGTEALKGLFVVQALGNVGRLLLNGDKQVEGLVVETLGRVIVTNVLDGVTDNLLVVKLGLGGDFTKDHNHASLGSGLASDLGEGILSQASVEDSIGDLIGDLVGMTLTDGLGLCMGNVSDCAGDAG